MQVFFSRVDKGLVSFSSVLKSAVQAVSGSKWAKSPHAILKLNKLLLSICFESRRGTLNWLSFVKDKISYGKF